MKNILLASTSSVYGKPYLSYLFPALKELFAGVSTVLFIPYARPDGMTYDEYTAVARKAFWQIDIEIKGIHEYHDPARAIEEAQGIFTGGGNTFLLLDTLYARNLTGILRDAVAGGTPYLGTSAGSNICGPNIKNTNDMPIVYPPSFEALNLIPFNINPHYLDPVENSIHMGETRETRIKEYLVFNEIPVLGIREGGWIRVKDDRITLYGDVRSRWFEPGREALELEPVMDLYMKGKKQF